MRIMGNNGAQYSSEKVYFLSATKAELVNLMGYRFSERALEEKIDRADAEIPVSSMFDRLYRMANEEKALMEISAKLKAAADFVDAALPTIKHVNKTGEEEKG